MRLIRIFMPIIFLLVSGCMSMAHTLKDKYPYINKTYIGVRADAALIFATGADYPVFAALGILDMPFSFVLDTLFLPYTITSDIRNKNKVVIQASEKDLAFDYITHNEQVLKLSEGSMKTYHTSMVLNYPDGKKGRYEFIIEYQNDSPEGKKTFYAIVDANRKSENPNFTLACITTLSQSKRDAIKDACTQSTVPLPQ